MPDLNAASVEAAMSMISWYCKKYGYRCRRLIFKKLTLRIEVGSLKAEYNHKEENKMAKKSKKYVEALNKIDRTRLYDATEALSLVAEVATAKFDETAFEAHIKLGVDSRHVINKLEVRLYYHTELVKLREF